MSLNSVAVAFRRVRALASLQCHSSASFHTRVVGLPLPPSGMSYRMSWPDWRTRRETQRSSSPPLRTLAATSGGHRPPRT
eukprot:1303715-Prymnesium_polylepis.1